MLVIPTTMQSQATESRSQYLATCWRIKPRNRPALRFTDHPSNILLRESDNPRTFLYTPTNGVDASARRRVSDAEASNREMRGIISDDAITSADLRAGVYDGAEIDEFLVDPRIGWTGYIEHLRYFIQSISFDRGTYEAEITNRNFYLAQQAGQVWTPRCRAQVFDSKCKLDPAAYEVEVTVTSHTEESTFTELSGDFTISDWDEDGFGDLGSITWISGSNKGRVDTIAAYNYQGVGASDVYFQRPPAFLPQVGDKAIMLPGCNKIAAGAWTQVFGSPRVYEGDCKQKYDNVINFRGEPFIPGRDRVLRGKAYN